VSVCLWASSAQQDNTLLATKRFDKAASDLDVLNFLCKELNFIIFFSELNFKIFSNKNCKSRYLISFVQYFMDQYAVAKPYFVVDYLSVL
jgi:hypothetical protein